MKNEMVLPAVLRSVALNELHCEMGYLGSDRVVAAL